MKITFAESAKADIAAFIVDEVAVRRNLSILADVKKRSGAKILCAMKAFSMR